MVLSEYPFDPKEMRRRNIKKYAIPPSWDLIEMVVKKSRLKKLARFEYSYGIPKDTLTWYKNGIKMLPPKHWHIFYEFDMLNAKYNSKTVKPKTHSVLHSNREILDDVQ